MILPRLLWVTDRLIDLSVVLGAAGLLVALGVTATDVIGRAFGTPLYGARDVVSMAGVFVVFGGMAQAHRLGSHVAVDLFVQFFPPALNRVLVVLAPALGALVFGLIAWQLYLGIALARMLNSSTNLLYLPRAPFLVAMCALAAICALAMALSALQSALAPADADAAVKE